LPGLKAVTACCHLVELALQRLDPHGFIRQSVTFLPMVGHTGFELNEVLPGLFDQ